MSLAKRVKLEVRKTGKKGVKKAVNDVIQSAPEYDGNTLLAKSYFKNDGSTSIQDPTGWWQSEKFDGYRAVWTGSKFVSRNNKEFIAPQWFKDTMPPKVPLDGELWMGRQSFESTGGLRHKTPHDDVWANVQFLVFDMPTVKQPFEDRKTLIDILVRQLVVSARQHIKQAYPDIWSMVKSRWVPIKAVKHKKVKNKAQVVTDLNKIVKQGGEGLMLRQPGSRYEGKRSST